MIFRPFTLISLGGFLFAGMHVYQTKHEAAVLDRELRGIARKVEDAEARTQTLQAEWAWLNEPERLRGVAQRHLPALEAMQPGQFIRASEAERRLPTVVAYAGPTALFALREATTPPGSTSFALLPRVAAPVQVAVAQVPVMPPAVPTPAPAPTAATAQPVAPAVAARPVAPATVAPMVTPPPAAPPARAAQLPSHPLPAAAPAKPAITPAPMVAQAPAPAIRLALPAAPPRETTTRQAEPRSVEALPRPAVEAPPRPAVEAPPRPAIEAPPRPALVDLARITQPRPAPPRPAQRPAQTELAALPAIAAPVAAPAPRQAMTQVAAAARPVVAEPPRTFVAQGGFVGGSALGGGTRSMLPPPVPFGSAGAATLGSSGLGR